MSDALDLEISEDAYQGDAQFTVDVDGVQVGGTYTATASHAAGQDQLFALAGSWGNGPHTVEVNFLNDLYGGPGYDRNLYVDSGTYDGAAISGAPAPLYSDGSASFGVAATNGASTVPLVVNLSEDAWQGDAAYSIAVDGVQIASGTEAASHGAGQSQALTFNESFAPGSTHDVAVTFSNDAYGGSPSMDRNLWVDGITLGGTSELSSDTPLYSNGTVNFAVVTPSGSGSGSGSRSAPPAGFYVSASGNDSGDGSAAHPFATLARATTAMEGSSLRTTYVEGTISQGGALTLGSADSGFTYAAASGGGTVSGTGGVQTLFDLTSGASGVTISGLTLQNTSGGTNGTVLLDGSSGDTVSGDTFSNVGIGVEAKNGANGETVSDNTFNGVSAANTVGGAFYAHGSSGDTISHNLIENTQGAGISLSDFYGPGNTATENLNDTVSYNDIENTDLGSTDSGAIYVLGRSIAQTNTTVKMNFINGTGPSSQHSVGIYLDDNASGVTATDNIVTGIGSDAFEIHGGSNDTLQNNIFDLGTGSPSAGLFQGPESDQPNPNANANNVVTGNVFESESTAPRSPLFANYSGGSPATSGNDFWSTAGASLNAGAGQSYVNPGSNLYATSGDGVGFAAIDRTQMGLLPA